MTMNEHRDKLHREIVITTMKLHTVTHSQDFDLFLKEPFEFEHSYYRPYDSDGGPEILKVMGIDGSTGELICKNHLGNERFVYYKELTLEELIRLHRCVLQGEYVLQLLN